MLFPEKKVLLSNLDNLAGARVLVLGDIMLDHFIFGAVSRISPEAPVPVVHVQEEKYYLGGAGNVLNNIHALGGQSHYLGVIGDSDRGTCVQDLVDTIQCAHTFVNASDRLTTKKTRIIAETQQVVRYDHESNAALPDSVKAELVSRIYDLVPQFDVVIVSDYGKGVINGDTLGALHQAVADTNREVQILIDPKTCNFPLYSGSFLMTPNAKEACEGLGLSQDALESDLDRVGFGLMEKYRSTQMLVTLGKQGMALFGPGKVKHIIPTFARSVFDVTGAGDTVISMIGLSLAAGNSLLSSCLLANYAAGIVVGRVGTATASIQDVRQSILELHVELEA